MYTVVEVFDSSPDSTKFNPLQLLVKTVFDLGHLHDVFDEFLILSHINGLLVVVVRYPYEQIGIPILGPGRQHWFVPDILAMNNGSVINNTN